MFILDTIVPRGSEPPQSGYLQQRNLELSMAFNKNIQAIKNYLQKASKADKLKVVTLIETSLALSRAPHTLDPDRNKVKTQWSNEIQDILNGKNNKIPPEIRTILKGTIESPTRASGDMALEMKTELQKLAKDLKK